MKKEKFVMRDKIELKLIKKGGRMKKKEKTVTIKGQWEIKTIDLATGKIIDVDKGENLILNAGKERVAKLLCGVSSTDFTYIAIGTGTTAPTVTDTALETEVARESAVGGGAYEASYKAVFEKTFNFGSAESYAITEAGLSDSASASGETLFDRFTFSNKNVDADTALFVRITITVSA